MIAIPSFLKRGAFVLLSVSLPACGDGGNPNERTGEFVLSYPQSIEGAVQRDFRDVFRLKRTVELEQGAGHVVARISGMSVAENGLIAVADASEGNIKVFQSNGRFVRALGRAGGGPGEFNDPRFADWDNDGRLHVIDRSLKRITVFDRDGELLDTTPFHDLGTIWDFEVLSPTTYLVAGFLPDIDRDEILHTVVVDGDRTIVQSSMLPIRGVRPVSNPESAHWRYFRRVNVDVEGDSAVVTSEVADSLWWVNLSSGAFQSTQLEFPGRIPATVPDPPPVRREFMEWFQSGVQRTFRPLLEGNVLAVPFALGVQHYGDPQVILLRLNSNWVVVSDAPPLIHADNGYFVTLETPLEDRVVLGFYEVGL